MRLAASFAVCALASTVLATWSTAARSDEPASLSPPLDLSEPPSPPLAPEPQASPEAIAPPPPAHERPALPPREHWYGKDILVTDGASIAAGIGLGLANPGAGAGVFVGGYALGGPLVHLVHGRPLAALGSLLLRVGAPTVGAVVGYSLVKVSSSGSGDESAGPAAALGVILGYAAAISLDAAVLAHEDVPADEASDSGARRTSAPASAAFSWAPTIAPVREGAVAGIGGRF